jgi:hypothetical protein
VSFPGVRARNLENRITRPLGIEDRSTITVLLVDRTWTLRWRGEGAFTGTLAHELETALDEDRRS